MPSIVTLCRGLHGCGSEVAGMLTPSYGSCLAFAGGSWIRCARRRSAADTLLLAQRNRPEGGVWGFFVRTGPDRSWCGTVYRLACRLRWLRVYMRQSMSLQLRPGSRRFSVSQNKQTVECTWKDAYDRAIKGTGSVGPPRLEVARMVEEGDVVMAELTSSVTRDTGAVMRMSMAEVFVTRHGKIAERRARG